MLQTAAMLRSRDRFGILTADEIAAIPGTERPLDVPMPDGHTLRVYEILPPQSPAAPAPLLINYHGGGFIKGRSARDRRYCAALAEALRCVVWDVDYILAPEAPFPAAAEESFEVVRYAANHAKELGFDPNRIALAGHSSGGNLVAAVCIRLAAEPAFRLCAALMEYFPADNSIDPLNRYTVEQLQDPRVAQRAETEQMYQDMYCAKDQRLDPLCSPIFAAPEQMAAFPDCLIISAEQDSLREETEAFARKLIESDVTVTIRRIRGAMHGFTTNRTSGWEEALDIHCNFFQTHLLF